jgi:hypothetical protein
MEPKFLLPLSPLKLLTSISLKPLLEQRNTISTLSVEKFLISGKEISIMALKLSNGLTMETPIKSGILMTLRALLHLHLEEIEKGN